MEVGFNVGPEFVRVFGIDHKEVAEHILEFCCLQYGEHWGKIELDCTYCKNNHTYKIVVLKIGLEFQLSLSYEADARTFISPAAAA